MNKEDAKRQAILDTAHRLFCEMGFEKTSISGITALVGGSKTTLYAYFGSKEMLFAECLMSAIERSVAVPLAALDGDVLRMEEALRQFDERYLESICSGDAVATRRQMFAQASGMGIGQLFFDNICVLRDRLATFLGQCVDCGRLRREDPIQMANHLRGLLDAEMPLLHADENSQGPDEISRAAKRANAVFLRAYAVYPPL